jgi:CheY-like chemotaxis protein
VRPLMRFPTVPLDEVPKHDLDPADDGRPVVLVADDEVIIASTLAAILRKNGFPTLVAYDGQSAMDLAKEIRFQLVIADVMMPKVTGVELAIAVTKINPDCKILLFSGQAATADLLLKAREAGYEFTTLFKPVHPADILRRTKAYFPAEEFPEIEQAS